MRLSRQQGLLLAGLAVLLVWPWLSHLFGGEYLVSVMTRVLIFAIAAVSLDLIVGYGALVSFGHAAFLGLGAYVTAISAFHLSEGIPLPLGFEGSLFMVIPGVTDRPSFSVFSPFAVSLSYRF